MNIKQHGVDFETAKKAFDDPDKIILYDIKHSTDEDRFICIGKVDDAILTVRYTVRNGKVRIFGAGYWRKQRKLYEKKNKKS